MPIYEYQCPKCQLRFSLIRPVGAQPRNVRCEHQGCKGRADRLVSVPAPAQFKGAGFYATDYKAASSSSES